MESSPPYTEKQRYQRRHQALKSERASWDPHWRELSDYIQPRRSRFLNSDANRGSKKNDNIINGTATWAHRVLTSGMMAGITSPARDWFRLVTPDPDLNEFGAVKEWLYTCEQRMRLVFQRSNLYNSLHITYQDLGWAGVATLFVEEDLEEVIRTYVFPVGQYCLANSARLRVDTCYREFGMTVGQVVKAFTYEQCSPMVQSQWRNGNYDAWVQIGHGVEPNDSKGPGLGAERMRWKSCYWEVSSSDEKVLRKEGYEEFPLMCPRWTVTGEDVYGSSPAMEALGDVRALQELERMGGEAFDKIVNPPMRAPMALQSQAFSLLPGSTTFVDSITPGQSYAPAMEINPQAITVVEAKLRAHEQRIKTAFYADLWLMMAESEGTMTAREVSERHEEKMLQLGPVMERLQDELLDPLIRRTFAIMWRGHYLPDPPPELQGQDLKVEYISTMAQAQKLLGTSAVERLASFVGNLSAVFPSARDMLNTDQMVQDYSQMVGVPPAHVYSDEEVAKNRAAAAQQQQAAAQQQQMAQGAEAAKTLSQADMTSDNALTRIAQGLGAAGPGAGG